MEIKLKIKYYVSFADLMGKIEYINLTKQSVSYNELFDQIKFQHTEFKSIDIKQNLILLVNGKIFKAEQNIHYTDEVALLSVMMGG